MYNAIICRYHEIATKGDNRSMFERCLVSNIRRMIQKIGEFKVRRVRGRIWLEQADFSDFTEAQLAAVGAVLARTFGLESFSPAIKVPPEMAAIRTAAIASGRAILADALAEPEKIEFRVRARRSDKTFPLRSVEIEIDLTTELDRAFGGNRLKVNLGHADYSLGCEVRKEFAALFWNSFRAPGGLPVGSNPSVLTLLSGGIDSPVAAHEIIKRGCHSNFLTFHSSPYTPPETLEKVKRVAAAVNEFQSPGGTLYACNLAELQKLVRDNCTEKDRTVLYRRAMFRIAEMLAERIHCKALVTGEAVGQVASQTIVNLNTINRAIDMLILRPLIGADKNDAIRIAEKIGTLELSEEQVPDSCTVFAPSSPSTSVPLSVAEREELKIPQYHEVLEKIVGDIQIIA